MEMKLTESDLRFLVETVATERRDYDHIISIVRDKEDLLDQMMDDPKVVERLRHDRDALVRVSPYFLFSVLLREVRRELENRDYLFEAERRGRRVAIFDAPAVAKLLAGNDTRHYLTKLLCSFVKSETGTLYWQERGEWRALQFNPVDLDDMLAVAKMVAPELRPRYYRRVADLALFQSGIFPEKAVRDAVRPRRRDVKPPRSLDDYAEEGKHFYSLAARETSETPLRHMLETLADRFMQARSALNSLSHRLLEPHREQFFGAEGQAG